MTKPIPALASLTARLFGQKWSRLHSADALKASEMKSPGVYLLAYSRKSLAGRPVQERDVFYVGMTCSAGGLKDRIGQFRKGIEDNKYHSAAMRFYREFGRGRPYAKLRNKLSFYFAALPFDCVGNKSRAKPGDFTTLGHICAVEYYAIARVCAAGEKPKLNKLGPRELARTLG
jgi:hypothetical protein